MEVPENNGLQLKEAFSIGRKEFEEKLKFQESDDWLRMQYVFEDDTTYNWQDYPDDDSTPPDDTPSTTPSEKGTTITPVEKGPNEVSGVKTSANEHGPPPGHAPLLGAGHAPPPATEHGPPPGQAPSLGAGHAPPLGAGHAPPLGAGHAPAPATEHGHALSLVAGHAPPPASEHGPPPGHTPSLGAGHAPPPAAEHGPPPGQAPSLGAGHVPPLGAGHVPPLGAVHAPPPATEHGPPPGHTPSLGAGHAPPPASEHGPPPGAGHAPPPSEKRPTMKPLEENLTPFRTPDPWGIYRHIDNKPHPYRPSWMWTPAEKVSTVRPYYLPPTKAINEWNLHDHPVNHYDWGLPKYKFVFVTEPPPVHHSGTAILKIIFGVVGCLVACFILARYSQKSKRNRRDRVLAVDAGALEQRILDDSRPSVPGETGPVNNDLPPPYYECTLYSINKCVSEDAKQQDHKQLTDQCTNAKNNIGFDGFNENVAPEMRTELVFDNGRIVERASLTNNETGVASNDNVEQLSTRNADFNDKVVYTDETGKGKINK